MAPPRSLPQFLPIQPTNSPDFNTQMPNVFVVPPEEDQAPPWCCFDAGQVQAPQPPAHTFSKMPDMDSLQSRLNFLATERVIADGTPVFQRSATHEEVVMPKKVETAAQRFKNSEMDGGNTGNDSEVVEVVKVSRNRKDKDMAPQERGEHLSGAKNSIKRSMTFKLKAAKALNSIRSLGKGGRHSKPSAKEIFPVPSHTQPSRAASFSSFGQAQNYVEETETPANDRVVQTPKPDRPTVSRRGSVVLSQIFSPRAHSSPELGVQHSDSATSNSSSMGQSSTQSTIETVSSASPSLQLHRISASDDQHAVAQGVIDPDSLPTAESDDYRLAPSDSRNTRPTSPSLTINTLDSRTKRRFSMMNIRNIFTFSSTSGQSNGSVATSNSAASANLAQGRDSDVASLSESELGVQLDAPRLSRTTAVSASTASSETSSGVETPTEEVAFLPMTCDMPRTKRPSLDWRIPEFEHVGGAISDSLADSLGNLGAVSNTPVAKKSNMLDDRDVSVEMRLDSLHFDSISFDPENFNVSEFLK
ncbi:hypothetical protein PC9H_001176 [Pleurotus ostreatus]|uniref:Uncharacterized protein n=1 Tax=Pleurotus ostreatus TaxID=5322 RepID=A0A8H7DYG1_PLEOS|nr:uncharacterized protein PC9H_001176 [Pleurotus ostreatus]KAF7440828.1 hypothetical protein PC9H_001176 [Pleurotus ostreatus]KAJ8699743.1 hypothetical protein PTI98_002835 [Pleurotus ostreatus]